MLTIGMPVYNDVDFIEESLKSVLNQSFKDFVLIISDDCSTDGSSEVCLQYARMDSRIKYIRQNRNLGISKNMEYLLSLCDTKYFMWAGDDDLMEADFVKVLYGLLENNPSAVSAFCSMAFINEKGEIVSDAIDYDYSNPNQFGRLQFFIENASDYFGYGMFVTERIKGVRFPVWWWPNAKTPYNNIFPTLCFYLTKGDFAYQKARPLFFKRIKTEAKTHHPLVGRDNALKESLAFWIRKYNLVCFSLKLIMQAGSLGLSARLSPVIFYFWFIVPSVKQLLLVMKAIGRRISSLNKKNSQVWVISFCLLNISSVFIPAFVQ